MYVLSPAFALFICLLWRHRQLTPPAIQEAKPNLHLNLINAVWSYIISVAGES